MIEKIITYIRNRIGRMIVRIVPYFYDKLQLQRFSSVSKQYSSLCSQLDPEDSKGRRYASGSEGYDWKHHTEEIKNSFKREVPLYSPDEHNHVKDYCRQEKYSIKPIPVLENKHEYAFR